MGVEYGEIFTIKQLERYEAERKQCEETILKALQKLVDAPEVKDLIKNIKIKLGENPAGTKRYTDDYGCWDELYLKTSGLVIESGYDKHEEFYGVWDNIHHVNEPENVQPSINLVRKYQLTERPLRNLIARLKA